MKNIPLAATALALSAAVISGTNNFLTSIAVKALKDPVLYTAIKNSLVAVFLIGIFVALRRWRDFKGLSREQWTRLAAVGIIGGSVPFGLYFTGLSQTAAVNASLIHKTLFIWVAVLAMPLLKERLSYLQWAGVGAIFAANLFVGGFGGFRWNSGELMILAATLLWAVENIIAKKALSGLSSTTVASARMVLGSVFLFAYLAAMGRISPIVSLNSIQWYWTLLTSALLLGYVTTWYAALKRAPASYVAALLVPATLITNVLSAVFVSHTFTGKQVASTALYIAGAALIVFGERLVKRLRERGALTASAS